MLVHRYLKLLDCGGAASCVSATWGGLRATSVKTLPRSRAPSEKCGNASRGESLAFISDLVNSKNLFKHIIAKNLISISAVDSLHRTDNILFIDHFSKWLEPPVALAALIERVGRCADGHTLALLRARSGLSPRHACAKLVGFRRFLCSATGTEVAIPILKERGRLSPVHGWNSIKASVSRLVRSFVSLYESGKCDYLMTCDPTYPKEFSLLLLSDFEGTIKKAAKCLSLFIKKVEAIFYGGAKLCVHENTHLWASNTPYEPHLHHHLNIPNAILTDHGLVRVRPGFFKGKKPDPEKLKLLRKLWKESIIATFGRVVPIDNWDSNLFVHYTSLKKRVALVHRLKYCARRAMSDFFENYHDDTCPRELKRLRFVLDLFGYKNPRHHYGWAINAMVNVQSAPVHSCPICHAPAKVLEISDAAPLGFHIVIWDHGLWNWIPPPGYNAKTAGAIPGGDSVG